jgi:hypothetical protein
LHSEKLDSLQQVPEVRLLTDEQITAYRDKESGALERLPRRASPADRLAIRHACNLEMHRAFVAAGLREGLPLQSKGTRLPVRDAAVMQTLSKELRDLDFVSLPVASKPSRSNPTNKKGPAVALAPEERAKTFNQWCAGNRLEKFAGVPATLMQMLQVEDVPVRLALIEQLAKVKKPFAGAMLANRAVMDLSPDVRRAAIGVLKKRPEKEYLPALLKGMRYPWPPVADHSAEALGELKPKEGAAALCDMLEQPDPRAPFRDPKSKRMVVAELVRLNHLRNCLLCHAPSADASDGLVRGLVPVPGRPLMQAYYAGSDAGSDNFVRADMTFLRHDFSANLKVEEAAPWPDVQRFDFVVRLRPATPKEIEKAPATGLDYPQRRAVLRALRGTTGQDGGDSPGRWRELLGVTTKEGR